MYIQSILYVTKSKSRLNFYFCLPSEYAHESACEHRGFSAISQSTQKNNSTNLLSPCYCSFPHIQDI